MQRAPHIFETLTEQRTFELTVKATVAATLRYLAEKNEDVPQRIAIICAADVAEDCGLRPTAAKYAAFLIADVLEAALSGPPQGGREQDE